MQNFFNIKTHVKIRSAIEINRNSYHFTTECSTCHFQEMIEWGHLAPTSYLVLINKHNSKSRNESFYLNFAVVIV
jgi:hypothetical protein